VYKEYTIKCTVCECDFTYDRRVQTKGIFSGRWMGAQRKYCSNKCSTKAKRSAAKTKGRASSKVVKQQIYRLFNKLGAVAPLGQEYSSELKLLLELEEVIDYATSEVPHDEITVQQNYIDAVNDMLELGVINSDQQIKMMKIAEKW
jgi:hypothetical protein